MLEHIYVICFILRDRGARLAIHTPKNTLAIIINLLYLHTLFQPGSIVRAYFAWRNLSLINRKFLVPISPLFAIFVTTDVNNNEMSHWWCALAFYSPERCIEHDNESSSCNLYRNRVVIKDFIILMQWEISAKVSCNHRYERYWACTWNITASRQAWVNAWYHALWNDENEKYIKARNRRR